MSVFDDIVAEFEGPATITQPSTPDEVSADDPFAFTSEYDQPTTFDFESDGQVYQLDTSGFNSEEEAIDAFLEGQNEPTAITEGLGGEGTNVQIPATQPPVVTDPPIGEGEFNPTFGESLEEIRQRFSKSAVDISGDVLRGSAIRDIKSGREIKDADLGQVLTGGVGGRDRAVAMQMFARLNKDPQKAAKELLESAQASAPGAEELLKHPLYKAGMDVKDFADEFFFTREEFDGSALSALSEGAGSLAAFMTASIGGPALTAMVGGNANAASQFTDAITKGASFDDALKAAEIGNLVGLTEALPISAVMARMNKATGGLFGKSITKFVKENIKALRKSKTVDAVSEGISGAIEEAIQEAFVEVMNNTSASSLVGYDPERDTFEGTGQAAAVGGTLGFVLSTVAGAAGRARRDHFDRQIDGLKQFIDGTKVDEVATDVVDQPTDAALPDVTDSLPNVVEQVTDPGVLPDPVNDPEATRLGAIRADVIRELGLSRDGADLSTSDIDRIANLRADTRPAGDQLSLDLGQEPTPVQGTLGLQRDFDAPGQFPDSGTQQGLPLVDASEVALDPTNVVGIKPPRSDTQKRLFRGLKEGGTARGYPGEFFTEDQVLAEDYARTSQSDGTVVTRSGTPARPFDVDAVSNMTETSRKALLAEFTEFSKDRGLSPEQGYMWDVLAKGERDFVYPIPIDVEFLESKGYDSVRFEKEGGQRVASWFIFGAPQEQQTADVLQFPQQAGPIERSLTTGNEANQRVAIDNLNAFEDRQRTDAAEQGGFDFTEQQEANRQALAVSQEQVPAEVDSPGLAAQQLRANDIDAAAALEEGQTLTPNPRLSPTEVPVPDQGQLALREGTTEPIQQGLEQELPLEGGGAGRPPEGRIPPPTQPPSGRGPTPPPTVRGGASTQALARVAESRSIVGDPDIVEVSESGDAIGVDGRSFKNKVRDGAASLRLVPKKLRVYVDIARNLSVASLRTTKELVRAIGAQGRALGTRTHNSINRLESLYKAEHGEKLSKAPKEHLRLINRYMHGLIGRSVVEQNTNLSEDFLDKIDEVRRDIKELSDTMLRENMLPDELRASFEENAGSYLHVIYAANVLRTDRSSAEILDAIPEEVRNLWVREFTNAYLDPIKNGELADMNFAQLARVAKNLRVSTRAVVPDRKNGGTKDAEVINGVEVATMNRKQLQEAISDVEMTTEELTNTMLVILRSVSGSLTGGKGKDRSIERRRTLARSAEQLREAGYSEKEIRLNESTRELLMETTDPITNIGTTMTKMMNTIMAHRLVNNMATLEQAGIASLGQPDAEQGLTELLIPEGHALGDIRIPTADGQYMHASTQGTSTRDGLFVHPETARLFQHMVDVKPGSTSGNFFRWTAGVTKINLTAFNPRSHTRNTLSAAMTGFIRGHWFSSGKTMAQAFDAGGRIISRDFARRNQRQGGALRGSQDSIDTILEYMTSLGILNDSVRTGPVKELLTKALAENDAMASFGESTYMDWDGLPVEEQLNALAKGTKGKVVAAGAKLAEYPMAAFRLEDEGMKVIAFMIERRRHADLTGNTEMLQLIDGDITNPTPEQLDAVRGFDQAVAKHITNLYPTYSRVPSWVRFISRNVFVGPFPSFNAEMWRNGLNDWKDLADLMRTTGRYEGVDKAKAHALVSRRITAKATYNAYTAAMSGVIGLAGMSAIGLDPTDEDQEEAFLAAVKAAGGGKVNANAIDMPLRAIAPAYIADSWFQIIDFVPGETIRLRNLAFTLPNSQQAEFGTNMAAGIEALLMNGDYERAGDAILQGTVNLASDYLKQDVLASALLEANDGITATGFRIWDERIDDVWTRRLKGAEHVWNVAFPGSRVLKEGEKFADAYKDDRTMEEMTEFVLGINDVDYRIDSLYVSQMRKLRDSPSGVASYTTQINRLLSDNKPISDNELIEQYLELESRRKDAFHDLQRMTRNGESLGMTRKQMQRALAADGVGDFGGMNLRDMQRDKYKPHAIEAGAIQDLFIPQKKASLSPEERKQAGRDFRGTIRERVRLIRAYKQQVKVGDYTK